MPWTSCATVPRQEAEDEIKALQHLVCEHKHTGVFLCPCAGIWTWVNANGWCLYSQNVLDKPSFLIKLRRSRGLLYLPPPILGLPYLWVPGSPPGVCEIDRNWGKGCFSLSFQVNDLWWKVQSCPVSVFEPKTFALSLSPSNNSFYCLKFH